MSAEETWMMLMREQYRMIYYWYAHDEFKSASRLAADNLKWQRDNENIRKYLQVVRNMAGPDSALPEQMLEVAREIRSGALEFTCAEMVNEQDNLYTVAGRIIGLSDGLKEQNSLTEPVQDEAGVPSKAEYIKTASSRYSQQPQDIARNLGGSVALIDTNWEMQQLDGQSNMRYRDPDELYFTVIRDEKDNLFALASVDQVSIISIQIKDDVLDS